MLASHGEYPLSVIARNRLHFLDQNGKTSDYPALPAMPDSVLLLELLSSSHSADLHSITEIIRNDIGLTVEVLRLAAAEPGRRFGSILNIGSLVVEIGMERLKNLASATQIVMRQSQADDTPQLCEMFWRHARRVALISEELAKRTGSENCEVAYLAGLLRHLGSLPALLGWNVPNSNAQNPGDVGSRLAKAWQFPPILIDVIRGNESACTSVRARRLLRLVNDADAWASRLEFVSFPEMLKLQQSQKSTQSIEHG